MADKIGAQTDSSPPPPAAEPDGDPKSFNFDQFIEQMMDPDRVIISLNAKSDGGQILGRRFGSGIVGVQMGYNQQDGFDIQPNAKVTPKAEEVGTNIGGKNVDVRLVHRRKQIDQIFLQKLMQNQ